MAQRHDPFPDRAGAVLHLAMEGAVTKRLDPDVKALKNAIRWIEKSTSPRMKAATAEFIYDRYVRHPRHPRSQA